MITEDPWFWVATGCWMVGATLALLGIIGRVVTIFLVGVVLAVAAFVISEGIIRPAHAGLNTSCHQPGPNGQPAPAAAKNYNCLRIYDNWRSSATIDGSDTRNAGFTWYTHNGSTQGPNGATDNGWNFGNIQKTPTTDWSVDNAGQLTLQAVDGTIYDALPIMLMSCAQIGTTQNLVGTIIGSAFYFEASMGTIGNTFTNSIDPIAWMPHTTMLIGGAGATWGNIFEPDFFEGFWGYFIHLWTGHGTVTDSNDAFSSSGSLTAPITIAARSVPASLNGGTTALWDRYENGSVVSAAHCDFTASAATCNGSTANQLNNNPANMFDGINTGKYCLAIGGGVGTAGKAVFKETQVWMP